ncbi:MAG: MAPEG family protein [Sphingomonadaceae bacterium]|nr:MAPEG family protein [Sphingomonadaceae bacterium]
MHTILLPVIALVVWTLVVLGWMVRVRAAAVKAKGIDIMNRRGGRGQDLEKLIEPAAAWPAHNYAHLVEQPTLFYAVCLALAFAGLGSGTAVWLAWAYVALRVAHSFEQNIANRIRIRATLFLLSSAVLAALALLAGWRVVEAA